MIKEQAQQAHQTELFRQKLAETQGYVRRLESAYQEQASVNSQLQTEVKQGAEGGRAGRGGRAWHNCAHA